MMGKFIKENTKTIIILILFLLMLITGYYAYSLREKYINSRLNTYNEAFNNVVNYVNNVENYLAKAMISKSSEYSAEALTQIWRDSNLAEVYLSQIPISSEGLSKTAKFLNQVSDYTYTLSKKSMKKEELNSEDFDNLEMFHKYSLELENTLNELSRELDVGTINWDSIGTENKFAQAVANVEVFSNIDSNLNEYEGLIYDGAYSDHVDKAEKKGLTGEDIDESTAKTKAEEYFGKDNIEKIDSNGFIENAKIPCYDFSVKLKNNKGTANIEISKKGGHIIQTFLDREVKESKLSAEEVNEKGKQFLESKGFTSMKETYYMKEGNILTVNYAYQDGDVIVYPDLIKVKVALDNGEILGIETTGYLNSHTDRKIENSKISIDEARAKINEKLKITSERRAIIPTEWKTEILCYEFQGKVDDKEFLVYINVETGEEEDILVILDTPGGILTT